MKIFILFLTLSLLSSCSDSTNMKVVNDKLFNGYSYPVEGGISSTYGNEQSSVMFFYNVKTNNLLSICSGVVTKVKDDTLEVDCNSNEKIIYYVIEHSLFEKGDKVKAGEKIASLENTNVSGTSRFKLNVVFYPDKDDLDTTFTNEDFFNYLHNEREDYEKK